MFLKHFEIKPALNLYYVMLNKCLFGKGVSWKTQPLWCDNCHIWQADLLTLSHGQVLSLLHTQKKKHHLHKHYFTCKGVCVCVCEEQVWRNEKAWGVDNSPNRFISEYWELHPRVEFTAWVLKGLFVFNINKKNLLWSIKLE